MPQNEHIKALFEGQELSEDFKEKTESIIETVVNERVQQIEEQKEQEVKQKVDEKTKELESLTESYLEEEVMPVINRYLTAAVNEWLENNEEPLVSEARVNLADSFMKGLVGLHEQHNLSVPEGSDSIVSKLEEQVEKLNSRVNELTEERVSIKEENESLKRERVQDKVVSEHDLAESQVDKIRPVMEKLSFKDEDQFESAVKGIVESYFPTDKGDDKHIDEGQKQDKGSDQPLNEQGGASNPYFDSLITGLRSQ